MKCKVLSGTNPWWAAIMLPALSKRVENRKDTSSAHKAMRTHRGPLLLHASAGVGKVEEFDWACRFIRDIVKPDTWAAFERDHLLHDTHKHAPVFRPGPSLPRGIIIGRCRVTGLIEPDGTPHREEGRNAVQRLVNDFGREALRWHIPNQWGHVLADVEPLEHVAASGSLGLWTFDYAAALAASKAAA